MKFKAYYLVIKLFVIHSLIGCRPTKHLLLIFITVLEAITTYGGTANRTKIVLSGDARGRKRPLNILFIIVDDLRPELGCYGAQHVRSPNIDHLAASGALFDRAYCQFPLCAPSRASLLSGTRPSSTKVFDLYTDFREALPAIQSLPQFFKDNGYYTDRFGKVFHIDDVQSWSKVYPPKNFGPSQPERRSPYVSHAINEAGWKKFEQAKAAGLTGVALERSQRGPAYEIADVSDDSLPDGRIALEAIIALKSMKNRQQPFFIAVGFNKPHLPFVAPRKYWELYDRKTIKVADNVFPPADAPLSLGSSAEFFTYTDVPEERPVPADYARIARHGYYACISYIDAQVGRILTELDLLGLTDNTIVVLWGDNGFKLGEYGSWGKSSNFELDSRIPLIIRVPGYPENIKIRGLVEMIDIYPTLAELTGFAIPSHTEGKSLAALLNDPTKVGKDAAFTQCTRLDRMGYSMRTERYRFTRWVKNGEKDMLELYDHANDPGENTNLAVRPDLHAICKKLSKLMESQISVKYMSQGKTYEQ